MAFKFVVLAACVAFASAGLIGQPQLLGTAYSAAPTVSHVYNSYGLSNLNDQHALGLSEQNILRTHGGTVSQISKQVVSPHSSVSKSVTTVNNDGYKTVGLGYAQPAIYAQPAVHTTYAQPAIASYAQPAITSYAAQPAYASYATQKVIAQPAIASYAAQPAYASYAAPIAQKVIAQPAYTSYAAPIAQKVIAQPALGYADHGAVVHASYASPIVNYGW